MTRRLISSGSDFEKIAGYSRAVVQGDWVFVAGTTGYDPVTKAMPENVIEQTRNCFATINKALGNIAARNKTVANIDRDAVEVSERNISAVLQRQRDRLESSARAAQAVRTDNLAIRTDIEDSLVQLQFQDRVSQILAQLSRSMRDAGPLAATGHLDAMKSQYTTDEQRRIHDGLDAEVAAPQSATFF